MKIGFITPFFSPKAGGSAIVPYLMAKSLTNKHDFYIFTSNYYRNEIKFPEESFLKIIEVPLKINFNNFYFTPYYSKILKKYINELDILHMHNYRTYQNIVSYDIARKYNVPYIIQPHGSYPISSSRPFYKILFDLCYGNKLLNDSNKIITVNSYESSQLMSNGVPKEKISVINNGVDLGSFSNLPKKCTFRKQYGIKENIKIILYVGRINKTKGIDVLLNAFSRLNFKEKYKLIIVGPDENLINQYIDLSKKIQISDYVIFTGPLYDQNKLEVYVDADVLVLPSYYEIWGLTILEAYACGIPVIASNIDGLKELVINEKTGLLFKKGNIIDLKNCLQKILDNPEESIRMGLNGKNFVQRFDMKNIANKLDNLYSNINRNIYI